jgi:hypothetical protein
MFDRESIENLGAVAENVARGVGNKTKEVAEETESVFRHVWNGFLEDLRGGSKTTK